MTTNVRNFLRDFGPLKMQALQGESITIHAREGEFLFCAVTPNKARKSLLGSARNKIVVHGDLTLPTLPDAAWKPSL